MENITNKVDNVLIAIGTLVGLDNIESILGIIILGVQLIWILWKGGYKIYELVKHKKYDQIDDTLEDTIEDLNNLKGGKNNGI